MSQEDIAAGSRWLSEIQTELSRSSLGIICITPENQASPWLLFEAGALSKALAHSNVCPLLLDLVPSHLSGPLSQFQASEANKEGIERIVASLNKSLGDAGIAADDVHEIVEVWWPRLEQQIGEAFALKHDQSKKRSMEEILEEVVSNSREQLRRENLRIQNSQEKDRRFDEFLELMGSSMGSLQQLQGRFQELTAGAPKLDELARFLSSPQPTLDVQRVLGSVKELTEQQKVFEQQILQGPKKDDNAGPKEN